MKISCKVYVLFIFLLLAGFTIAQIPRKKSETYKPSYGDCVEVLTGFYKGQIGMAVKNTGFSIVLSVINNHFSTDIYVYSEEEFKKLNDNVCIEKAGG